MLFSAVFLKTEILSARAVAGVLLAIAGVIVILAAG
jgi:drug/metabolite transporter (DMT)-like permease